MYRILLGSKPRKVFHKSDGKTQKKLRMLFEALEVNPWPARDFDLAKIESMADCFRVRIGSFRVCYHVQTEKKEITVYRIERRSERTYR